MRTKTTTTKAKSNSSLSTSFDVSYAEILAEVQKLQQMLDGNLKPERKQRKKRSVEAKAEETPIEAVAPSASVDEIPKAEGDNLEEIQHDAEEMHQPTMEAKAKKNRYKVSNLDEIREKISEVKELIQEADQGVDQEAATTVAASENSEGEPQIFQATKDVVEENADITIDPQSAQTINDAEEQKPLAEQKVDEGEDPDLEPPKDLIADAPQSDLDAYFMDKEESPKDKAPKSKASKVESSKDEVSKGAEPVGIAKKRQAAQMAKHGVKDKNQIVKAKAEHDKSGPEWGGPANLEEDPGLEQPQP